MIEASAFLTMNLLNRNGLIHAVKA